MTLLFLDSFDHYATADITKKYNSNSMTISANGRNGTNAIGGGYTTSCAKTVPAKASFIMGAAVKITAAANTLTEVFKVKDGSITHTCILIDPSGTLCVSRGTTTIILGPSTKALYSGAWYYIEFKFTIDDAASINSCEVRVNGETWLKNTSGTIDTRNAGNASANSIQLVSVTGTTYFDDFYIEDGDDATATQGAPFNDFLGDCRVRARLVGADGNYTGSWTRNGAGVDADYKAVDEASDDGDTTYLSDSTPTHRSSWTMINLTDVGTVKAVQTVVGARKDDAGARTLDTFLRKSGADSDAGDNWSLSSSYLYYTHIYGRHPDTTAWTPAGVDAIELGINEVA